MLDTDSRPELRERETKDLLARARDESLHSMGALGYPGRRVPDRVVSLSRLLSAVVVVSYFVILDTHPLSRRR